ncbi:MAG: hypothetical protein DI626_11835 [Micavibrio aeruginosavorus]|uniref:DNA-binding protein n=1 Tax=Micavibrio aeruginosavorus TaxID=349221 RepID=A0A2W4ZBB6_9BACT|nr:MAG: hypothetical protein DI626_11835 [Micavibrio aeruginosavorus]
MSFLKDKEIANDLGMSVSWVRVQRHLRVKGLAHVFEVEPVYIGRSPRYPREAYEAWKTGMKGGEQPTRHP